MSAIRVKWTLLGVIAAVLLTACAPAATPRPFAATLPPFRYGARFVVVGDLQRTSLLEFWRESNDAERVILVRAIAALHPAFLAVTGDMVFDGSSAKKWSDLDEVCTPIREAGIPVVAAFGNHEYWGGREGETNAFAHVPGLGGRHWYTVPYGPLRLVFLDSNIDVLSASEWQTQLRWYGETLRAIDRDPEARGTFVLLHHPPFTNSTVTGDETYVQRDFVPPLLAEKKSLAMLSGHVHSYERFVHGSRTFVVSGGGGGPRAELATGSDRRHPDDLFAGPPVRPFHFTIYTVTESGVAAEVEGLEKGESAFTTIDRFFLPWPQAL